MNTLTVTIPTIEEKSYPIIIGVHFLEKREQIIDCKQYSQIVIITDTTVESLMVKNMLQFFPENTSTIALSPGEQTKHMSTVLTIWEEMARLRCDRKTLVINIGGGVIGDMGAFAASTYMRGVEFINIPTTLLSMVDESVGGKTGINFESIKNLIGTFAQPKAVIIDVHVLKTLPKRELIAGFAEIIKHGLIADRDYFEKVTAKKPEEFSEIELEDIISGSCQIKADIVREDEREKGKRKVLNLGHTVGHALEILSKKTSQPLLHGEAISIGITVENQIAVALGMLSQKTADFVREKFLYAGLPVTYKGLKIDEIIETIRLDKKNERGKIKFTLLKGIGEAIINQHVEEDIIKTVLKSTLEV